jgi:CheY-like chemotaxis protein
MRAHANQEFQSGALVQSRPAPRLLVVEDEVLVRMMIAEELRDAGFPVLEAAHADEAIDMLRHVPGIKLVISDIRMPGSMDGITLARLARSEHPNIKIIFACGSHCRTNSIRHEGLFLKPYYVPGLVQHVKKLMDDMSIEQPRSVPRTA